jgi:hypothetical protein
LTDTTVRSDGFPFSEFALNGITPFSLLHYPTWSIYRLVLILFQTFLTTIKSFFSPKSLTHEDYNAQFTTSGALTEEKLLNLFPSVSVFIPYGLFCAFMLLFGVLWSGTISFLGSEISEIEWVLAVFMSIALQLLVSSPLGAMIVHLNVSVQHNPIRTYVRTCQAEYLDAYSTAINNTPYNVQRLIRQRSTPNNNDTLAYMSEKMVAEMFHFTVKKKKALDFSIEKLQASFHQSNEFGPQNVNPMLFKHHGVGGMKIENAGNGVIANIHSDNNNNNNNNPQTPSTHFPPLIPNNITPPPNSTSSLLPPVSINLIRPSKTLLNLPPQLSPQHDNFPSTSTQQTITPTPPFLFTQSSSTPQVPIHTAPSARLMSVPPPTLEIITHNPPQQHQPPQQLSAQYRRLKPQTSTFNPPSSSSDVVNNKNNPAATSRGLFSDSVGKFDISIYKRYLKLVYELTQCKCTCGADERPIFYSFLQHFDQVNQNHFPQSNIPLNCGNGGLFGLMEGIVGKATRQMSHFFGIENSLEQPEQSPPNDATLPATNHHGLPNVITSANYKYSEKQSQHFSSYISQNYHRLSSVLNRCEESSPSVMIPNDKEPIGFNQTNCHTNPTTCSKCFTYYNSHSPDCIRSIALGFISSIIQLAVQSRFNLNNALILLRYQSAMIKNVKYRIQPLLQTAQFSPLDYVSIISNCLTVSMGSMFEQNLETKTRTNTYYPNHYAFACQSPLLLQLEPLLPFLSKRFETISKTKIILKGFPNFHNKNIHQNQFLFSSYQHKPSYFRSNYTLSTSISHHVSQNRLNDRLQQSLTKRLQQALMIKYGLERGFIRHMGHSSHNDRVNHDGVVKDVQIKDFKHGGGDNDKNQGLIHNTSSMSSNIYHTDRSSPFPSSNESSTLGSMIATKTQFDIHGPGSENHFELQNSPQLVHNHNNDSIDNQLDNYNHNNPQSYFPNDQNCFPTLSQKYNPQDRDNVFSVRYNNNNNNNNNNKTNTNNSQHTQNFNVNPSQSNSSQLSGLFQNADDEGNIMLIDEDFHHFGHYG